MNEESFKKGEKLIEIAEDKEITASVLDPIHELMTYVVDGK